MIYAHLDSSSHLNYKTLAVLKSPSSDRFLDSCSAKVFSVSMMSIRNVSVLKYAILAVLLSFSDLAHNIVWNFCSKARIWWCGDADLRCSGRVSVCRKTSAAVTSRPPFAVAQAPSAMTTVLSSKDVSPFCSPFVQLCW